MWKPFNYQISEIMKTNYLLRYFDENNKQVEEKIKNNL